MAREYVIEIDGVGYVGTTASAKNQFELLHIAIETGLVAHLRDNAQDMTKVAALGILPLEKINRIKSLVVDKKIFKEGTEIEVAENIFTDDIQYFYLLIFEAIRENISNFWKLRSQTEKTAAGQQNS